MSIEQKPSRPIKDVFSRLAAVSVIALAVAACGDDADAQASSGVAETPMTLAQAAAGSDTGADTGTDAGADADTDAGADTETAPAAEDETAAVEPPPSQGEVDMEAVLEEGALPDMVLGEADAPVTIVEYMSLTCPHCAAFHNETFDAVKEKYVDSGQVRFIVRDFPFDPRAAAGAMLARCAPEGQYFPMVDMLFEQQASWAAAEDARGALLQMSRMAGFTQESFEACLTNQELLDDVNAVRQKAAEEFEIQSTPTFLINGQRYAGNMSIEQMSAIIDSQF